MNNINAKTTIDNTQAMAYSQMAPTEILNMSLRYVGFIEHNGCPVYTLCNGHTMVSENLYIVFYPGSTEKYEKSQGNIVFAPEWKDEYKEMIGYEVK